MMQTDRASRAVTGVGRSHGNTTARSPGRHLPRLWGVELLCLERLPHTPQEHNSFQNILWRDGFRSYVPVTNPLIS